MSDKNQKQTTKSGETLLKKFRRFISKTRSNVSTTENKQKSVDEDDYGEAMRERLNKRRETHYESK